jgi:hypothetical protein
LALRDGRELANARPRSHVVVMVRLVLSFALPVLLLLLLAGT